MPLLGKSVKHDEQGKHVWHAAAQGTQGTQERRDAGTQGRRTQGRREYD